MDAGLPTGNSSLVTGTDYSAQGDRDAIWWPGLCDNGTLYNAFWSPALSIHASSPDLTQCFQDTVMVWVPCGALLLIALFYALYLAFLPRVKGQLGRSGHNVTAIVCGAALSAVYLLRAGFALSNSGQDRFATSGAILANFIQCISALVATALTAVEYRRGFHTSPLLCVYWLLTTVLNIVPFRSLIVQAAAPELGVPSWTSVTFYVAFALRLVLAGLSCVADLTAMRVKAPSMETMPLLANEVHQDKNANIKGDNPVESPYLTATFLSRLTFAWITPFLLRGYRRPIEFKTLHKLRDKDMSDSLVTRFSSYYNRDGEKPSSQHSTQMWRLFKGLVLANGPEFIFAFVLRVVGIFFQFLNPFIIRLLISFISDLSAPQWHGMVYAACMFLVNVGVAISIHWWIYSGYHTGQRIRTIINSVVYKKAIRLSSVAKRTTTVGEIVNLMSVDAQKLQDCPQLAHLFWSFPVMAGLALYFLYQTLGVAAFSGLIILALLLPINAFYLGNKIRLLQGKQMTLKDDRIRVMSEILNGIKVLKFYAWEPSFQKKTMDIRDQELKYLRWAAYFNGIGSVTWFLSPYLVSLVVFAVYVNTGEDHVLDADKAFVSMSLINILNFPIALLPIAVSYIGQGYVSLQRVSKFLMLDEIDSSEEFQEKSYMEFDDAVKMSNSTFSWGNDLPVLHNIDLCVKEGQLMAVVGQVGAGKSSLMSALLGEMKARSGSVNMKGRVAFVPQQAWIQNATLRDNILFGRPMVESVYNDVLEACALAPDLKILPGGDMTEIGEKGINLSGGQKQRVSLARAVYQDAEVYLLDDPLSAVDSHVGQHIFQHVIGPNGILQNKTRLLNTHGIGFLPYVDKVIVMNHGHISESDTYQELMGKQGIFAQFLQSQNEEFSNVEINDIKRTLAITDKDLEVAEKTSVTSNEADIKLTHTPKSSPRKRRRRMRSHFSEASMSRDFNNSSNTVDYETETVAEKTELISEETAETGLIGPHIIWAYIKAAGLQAFTVVVISHMAFIAMQVVTNIWLSDWTNQPVINGTRDRGTVTYRLGVYGGLGTLQVLIVSLEAIAVALGCTRASRVLHSTVLDRILHAPMSFFDTTPLGRILNRFSKDLDIVDTNLPLFIRFWLFDIAPLLSTVIIITYTTPLFLVVVVPLGVLYYWIQRIAVTNINQLKRLDAVRRSPIYAHFDESIVGLTSIRAYGKEEEFVLKCDRLVDNSQRAWFLYIIVARWIGVWVESLGALLVFAASMFAVMQRDTLSPGMAGLSVSYSLQLTLFLNVTIRSAAELETYVVSVERIREYTEVPQEAPWDVTESRPPCEWPSEGRVELCDYSTRYRPGLDLVLKGISCQIEPTERVGIVGRTGAGKSSLTLCLFRILEAAGGHITIDGIRIGDLGLHSLRSRLTIIPQDPVLFSGSLRSNLDPFCHYLESEIWRALEHAHLKRFASDLQEGLDYEVGENGEALSVGQRQLVCLARALLHKTKILILDEATAAVDIETDDLIQNTIRTQFTDCTIITIAHRLNTVMDYDRIMVLHQGDIQEFDSPANLLLNQQSMFSLMAKDAGISGLSKTS